MSLHKLTALKNFLSFVDTNTRWYRGSDNDIRNGFIYLATHEQLPGVLRRQFPYEKNLILITLKPGLCNLKWKNGRPRLYARLNICGADVESIQEYSHTKALERK
jgi:uncharacterized protein (DUF952 family)